MFPGKNTGMNLMSLFNIFANSSNDMPKMEWGCLTTILVKHTPGLAYYVTQS